MSETVLQNLNANYVIFEIQMQFDDSLWKAAGRLALRTLKFRNHTKNLHYKPEVVVDLHGRIVNHNLTN